VLPVVDTTDLFKRLRFYKGQRPAPVRGGGLFLSPLDSKINSSAVLVDFA